METSSHKNLSKNSRGLERNMRNANGEPERQTPSSSHQPPTLTRSKYLNMIQPHGIGWKDARAAVKKYDPVDVGGRVGGWRFFYEQAKRTLASFHSACP